MKKKQATMTNVTPDSSSKFGATTSSRSPRDVMDDFFGDAALQGFGAFQDDQNNVHTTIDPNGFSYLRSNLNHLVDTDSDDDHNDVIEDGYNDVVGGIGGLEQNEDEFYRFLPSVYSDDSTHSSLTDPFSDSSNKNKKSSSSYGYGSNYYHGGYDYNNASTTNDQPALILALVDPPTRRFELLQLNIQGDKARIEHLITSVIRSSAVDVDLGNLEYECICDYHAKPINEATRLIDLPSYHKSKGVGQSQPLTGAMMMFAAADDENQSVDDVIIAAQQSEVLVAVPVGESPIDCTLLARNIISHRRVIDSVSSTCFCLCASDVDAIHILTHQTFVLPPSFYSMLLVGTSWYRYDTNVNFR